MQTFDRIFGAGPRIHLTILSLAVLVYYLRISYAWTSLGLAEGSHITGAFFMAVFWAIIAVWSVASLGKKIGLNIMRSGPFAYVRNPMYTAEIFFGWLIVLFLLNTWLAIPAMFITYYLANHLVRYEEDMLEQQFGDKWRIYKVTTPKFFPKMHK